MNLGLRMSGRSGGASACICGVLAISGCLLAGGDSQLGPAVSQETTPIVSRGNAPYHLAVEFYGEYIGPDGEPPTQLVVDRIVVRDTRTGGVEKFMPDDADTLQSSFGYFTDVWSPDGAYLVLPLGRFQGFAVFASASAMEELREGHSRETIQIRLANGDSPMLWHEFLGWEGERVLRFSAGLSGRAVEFRFDPGTGDVRAETPAPGSFRAVTRNGVTAVSISQER
jgi:hypothetical protein